MTLYAQWVVGRVFVYWACLQWMLSDPIRLVSQEFRGQENTSLTYFLALPKLYLKGSVLSLCGKLHVRAVVLPYCMAMGGDWPAEMLG